MSGCSQVPPRAKVAPIHKVSVIRSVHRVLIDFLNQHKRPIQGHGANGKKIGDDQPAIGCAREHPRRSRNTPAAESKRKRLVAPGRGCAVSVLLNQGNGTLGAASSYAAGSNPAAMVAADLNGDARPDLAVLGANGVTVIYTTCLP